MAEQILSREDLKTHAQNMGVTLIKGNVDLDTVMNKIEIPDLKEFLEFHVHIENKLLFFEHEYESKEEYIINEEDLYMYEGHDKYEEYREMIEEQVKLKISKHNKAINEIDFKKPYSLSMYYINDGFLFYNETIKDDDPSIYEETLFDIVESTIENLPDDILEKLEMKHRQENDTQLHKLKDLIFTDPDFKIATNSLSRKTYITRLFNNNPEYKEIIRKSNEYYHAWHFIDDIWREFKAKGLHK
ncbi:hypothetical protein FOC88_27705 (plasmid) [Bacillus thuringiensis]|uniref:hypothetical protein n=1 Tax=Bacillus thuringiensis TaxID=1428 RepID=UPI0005A333B6|nr:hypothetical protein [Bacillus thuringiensis]AJH80285.1 hypothetical protein BF36_5425 [Bacillus thuringiensis]QKI16156.1 hypothetical protein FOC88_00450 [Bacillus thuringiensis]QKI21353.1 hypothetical protein FOC88_27705 [Bacillus thuringiensis]